MSAPVYVSIIPYADLVFANAYFAERTETEFWDLSDDATKQKALCEATRYIDTLPFIGQKTDFEQKREWPRDGDTDWPYDVSEACAEAANEIIRGRSLGAQQTKAGVASESVGDASVSYAGDAASSSLGINEGVIGPLVYRFLAPWLEDRDSFRIVRV